MIAFALGYNVVYATSSHSKNVWGDWKYDEWSSCNTETKQCGVAEGEQSRTKTRTCEKGRGEGYDECNFEKSCSQTLVDNKCAKQSNLGGCLSNLLDCFTTGSGQNKKYWLKVDWTYTPETQTEEESQSCKLPEEDVISCDEEGVCPTNCGLSASEVPDGQGGYKVCPATNSCEPIKDEDRNDNCSRNPAHPDCQHEPSAPVCSDGTILNLPANFHIMRKGDVAIARWVPTGGNLVDLYYRENENTDWTHSLGDQANDGELEVQLLDPNKGYTFGLRQHQGCGGGETVISVVIDPPANTWTMFTLSHWLWN